MLQTMPPVGHQALELFARILATPIRVMHQSIRRAAPPDSHQQRVCNELRCHVGVHRPADHPVREQVDDGRYIEPASGRPDVGEVGDPLLVRPLGGKLGIQKVQRHIAIFGADYS